MQIVIDIPDGCYEELNNGQFPVQDAYRLVAWIIDGKALPKGHGRLIDAEKLSYNADTCRETTDAFVDLISEAPTILESDRLVG